MNRRLQRTLLTLAGLLIVLVTQWILRASTPIEEPSFVATSTQPVVTLTTPETASSTVQTNALTIEAVDGDTIGVRIDGDTVDRKIRMLGVNTPESVDPRRPVECFGKEASKFTAQTLADKRIRLEEDPQADNVDKYGRLLRNIILEDGTDFNALLIREGYAYAYVDYPQNKQRKAELRRLQDEAKAEKRGLWNPETCGGMR